MEAVKGYFLIISTVISIISAAMLINSFNKYVDNFHKNMNCLNKISLTGDLEAQTMAMIGAYSDNSKAELNFISNTIGWRSIILDYYGINMKNEENKYTNYLDKFSGYDELKKKFCS